MYIFTDYQGSGQRCFHAGLKTVMGTPVLSSRGKESARTLELIKEAANRKLPGIEFTVDLPQMQQYQRCPMLDLEV